MTLQNVTLPKSIERRLEEAARAEGVSVDEFVAHAITEKVSQLLTMRYFAERAAKVDREAFLRVLNRAPDVPPMPGDELPKGWKPRSGS